MELVEKQQKKTVDAVRKVFGNYAPDAVYRISKNAEGLAHFVIERKKDGGWIRETSDARFERDEAVKKMDKYAGITSDYKCPLEIGVDPELITFMVSYNGGDSRIVVEMKTADYGAAIAEMNSGGCSSGND